MALLKLSVAKAVINYYSLTDQYSHIKNKKQRHTKYQLKLFFIEITLWKFCKRSKGLLNFCIYLTMN